MELTVRSGWWMSAHRRRYKLSADPLESAATAGLRYVEAASPGFTRRRAGRGFCYLDARGALLRDRAHLTRIRSLVIPPAWSRVWICPLSNGHLQATGYDSRGRRQYRYHSRYREVRDETKFARMTEFAEVLPLIRQKTDEDLRLPGLPRKKVLASVVRLLETTFIRIGNIAYAKENESFGLTTLRNRHCEIEGSTIRFRFRGKSGLSHEVELRDRRLAKIIRACHDLPGYNLFEYVDDEDTIHNICSGDVNGYIKDLTGEEFTAKDFRTWAGTVQTALALASFGGFESDTEAKRNVVAAIKDTATRLGNRPATCRAYYVHPAVIESYLDGSLPKFVKAPEHTAPARRSSEAQTLYPEEACVVRLIQAFTATSRKAA